MRMSKASVFALTNIIINYDRLLIKCRGCIERYVTEEDPQIEMSLKIVSMLICLKIICLFWQMTGRHFELANNPIQVDLNRLMAAVQLDGVQIENLDSTEGNKSFVMEITNATFLPKRGQTLSSDHNNSFIHKILNQTEVVIENNNGMLYVFHLYVYVNVYIYVCMYVWVHAC